MRAWRSGPCKQFTRYDCVGGSNAVRGRPAQDRSLTEAAAATATIRSSPNSIRSLAALASASRSSRAIRGPSPPHPATGAFFFFGAVAVGLPFFVGRFEGNGGGGCVWARLAGSDHPEVDFDAPGGGGWSVVGECRYVR